MLFGVYFTKDTRGKITEVEKWRASISHYLLERRLSRKSCKDRTPLEAGDWSRDNGQLDTEWRTKTGTQDESMLSTKRDPKLPTVPANRSGRRFRPIVRGNF